MHWEESPQAVTVNLRLGDVMPLLSSATGRCFAAYVSQGRDRADAARRRWRGRRSRAAPTCPPRWPRRARCWTTCAQRGAARVVDTLLPGIVGFCVPVFDSDGHMALGIVGARARPAASIAEWGGAVDRPLRAAAAQLSSDLGLPGMNARAGRAVAARWRR